MSNISFFRSEKIADNSYLIENDFSEHAPMKIYCYLIVGTEYALLIDTMIGIGNLKAYCETLTDKPVKVVNTHAHGDHILGNYHFDSCYMHVRDIPYFQTAQAVTKEMFAEQAKAFADDSVKDLIDPLDGNFADVHPIKVFPVSDGDVFDLGDRKIEVVEAGGHTPGSIVLIDDKTRIAYIGDVCNSNTLLEFKTSLPVSVYQKSLERLKACCGRFDMMYGGHEFFDTSIIDEGLETVAKVLAGTDAKVPAKGLLGYDILYAEERKEGAYERADGKRFNMSYDPDNITGEDVKKQIIKAEPPVLC